MYIYTSWWFAVWMTYLLTTLLKFLYLNLLFTWRWYCICIRIILHFWIYAVCIWEHIISWDVCIFVLNCGSIATSKIKNINELNFWNNTGSYTSSMETEQACYSISGSMLLVYENILFREMCAFLFWIVEVLQLPKFRTLMN